MTTIMHTNPHLTHDFNDLLTYMAAKGRLKKRGFPPEHLVFKGYDFDEAFNPETIFHLPDDLDDTMDYLQLAYEWDLDASGKKDCLTVYSCALSDLHYYKRHLNLMKLQATRRKDPTA